MAEYYLISAEELRRGEFDSQKFVLTEYVNLIRLIGKELKCARIDGKSRTQFNIPSRYANIERYKDKLTKLLEEKGYDVRLDFRILTQKYYLDISWK